MEAKEAPIALLKVPGAQLVHAEAPKPAAYLPATHEAQELTVEQVAAEEVPGPHCVHAAAARAALYEPGAQQEHAAALVAPVVPYLPAPQSVQEVDASAPEKRPATQGTHVAADSAKSAAEEVPAKHAVCFAEPDAQKWPGGHALAVGVQEPAGQK